MIAKKKTGVNYQLIFLILTGLLFLPLCFKGEYKFLQKTFMDIRLDSLESDILERVKSYEIIETKYSQVYYENPDEEYAELVSSMTDFYYPLLSKDLGLNDISNANIVLYPTEQKMRDAIDLDFGVCPMGMYYGKIIHILSPRVWITGEAAQIEKEFLKNGPVIHELTHYIMDLSIGSDKNPTWINEGVALYFENKYTNFQWRPDLAGEVDGITKGQLIDFRNQDEGEVYRRAYEVIENYVCENGESALVNILK